MVNYATKFLYGSSYKNKLNIFKLIIRYAYSWLIQKRVLLVVLKLKTDHFFIKNTIETYLAEDI